MIVCSRLLPDYTWIKLYGDIFIHVMASYRDGVLVQESVKWGSGGGDSSKGQGVGVGRNK